MNNTSTVWFELFVSMTQPLYSFVSHIKLLHKRIGPIPKQNAKLIILGDREMQVRVVQPYRWVEIFWLLMWKVAGKEKVYF